MSPIDFADGGKRDVRTQFAALCYKVVDNKIRVLLVTSRGTGRWILPKGWPMDGTTPGDAALQEAWEEAGVQGKLSGNSLGIYSYLKEDEAEALPCVVAVFPVKVKTLKRKYPEAEERKRLWCTRKKAASLVDEPELQQMLRDFDPRG